MKARNTSGKLEAAVFISLERPGCIKDHEELYEFIDMELEAEDDDDPHGPVDAARSDKPEIQFEDQDDEHCEGHQETVLPDEPVCLGVPEEIDEQNDQCTDPNHHRLGSHDRLPGVALAKGQQGRGREHGDDGPHQKEHGYDKDDLVTLEIVYPVPDICLFLFNHRSIPFTFTPVLPTCCTCKSAGCLRISACRHAAGRDPPAGSPLSPSWTRTTRV